MTINVDPELSEIVGWLEYRTRHDGFSREKVERALGWSLAPFFDDGETPNLRQLLQVLKAMRLDPCAFVLEVFHYRPPCTESYGEELQETLIRLLHEHLEVFAERPRLPTVERPLLAPSRAVDHLLLKERTDLAIDGVQDLAAAARWMLARLDPANRRMLTGLCERTGTYEAAIKAIPDLLAIVETPVEAAWSMQHQRQLMETPWRRADLIVDEINVEAVVFLLDLEIKAGLREDQSDMVKLREKLLAIGGEDD